MTPPSARALALARRVAPGEAFYDYTGLCYEPVNDPTGKWSSSFVLEGVLDAAGAGAMKGIVRSLGGAIGVDATVWGAKRTREGYSWELYFYDYTRQDPRFCVSRILDVIGRSGPSGLPPLVDGCPRRHFMFSVDVAPTTGEEGVHVYFYDVGERMTGLSYRFDASGWVLENHYAFYDPITDGALLREKVADSPRLGPDVPIERVLVADLLDCRRVCVANKPGCDGVYFSGVTVAQFIRFLETFGHDPAFVAVVRKNEPALDHMLYDVAFDYRTTPGGDLEIIKTGFYGTA